VGQCCLQPDPVEHSRSAVFAARFDLHGQRISTSLFANFENLAKLAKSALQVSPKFPYFQNFASGQRLALKGSVLARDRTATESDDLQD
jgi:hypothetical protein